MDIAAQCVGLVSTILMIISYQINVRKKIIFIQGIACIFFVIHFAMIGAFTGSAMNFITLVRSVIYYYRDKKWAQNKLWLILFSALYVAAGILTYENAYSIILIFAMILNTCGFWMTNTTAIRLMIMPCSASWLYYNFITHSIAGFLTEVFVLSSITVSLFRFDIIPWIKKKRNTDKLK